MSSIHPSLLPRTFKLLPLGLTVLASAIGLNLSLAPSAQALTWEIDSGTQTDALPPIPFTGTFTIDNESSPTPTVTAASIFVDGILTFTATNVFNVDVSGGGIEAIDWDNGLEDLSFVFETPLTPAGGTVALDEFSSNFTNELFENFAVVGSVTSTAVPEPLTLLGAATGIGFGAAFRRRVANSDQTK